MIQDFGDMKVVEKKSKRKKKSGSGAGAVAQLNQGIDESITRDSDDN